MNASKMEKTPVIINVCWVIGMFKKNNKIRLVTMSNPIITANAFIIFFLTIFKI